MDSRELGLVLAQQLLGIDELHYGWWAEGEAPSFAALAAAQRRHSEVLFDAVASMLPTSTAAIASAPPRALDVGCGAGSVTAAANARGWRCDGLVPAPVLAARARQRLAPWPERRVFECRLEDAAGRVPSNAYDLAWFSESFQYVALDAGLEALRGALAPDAAVVVFDVFARDDAPPGKSPVGGGHRLSEALSAFRRHGFDCVRDEDHSVHMAPNLDLLQGLLRDRLRPAAATLDRFLAHRYRLAWGVLKWAQRHRLEKLERRWGAQRDGATFLRYKTYRLLGFRRSDRRPRPAGAEGFIRR